MNVGERKTKHVFISEIVDEAGFVHVKNTNGDVWTISCRLAVQKSVCYLCPQSVAGEGDKQIEPVVESSESNRVLEPLVHIPGSADVRRGKDDAMTNVVEFDVRITCTSRIFKTTI